MCRCFGAFPSKGSDPTATPPQGLARSFLGAFLYVYQRQATKFFASTFCLRSRIMETDYKYADKSAVRTVRDSTAPWASHTLYAKRVSYIFCGFVILGLIIHLIRLLRAYRPRLSLPLASIPGISFLTAICRMFGYRRFKVLGTWLLQSHYLIIIGAVYIGTIVWCLSMWPYYRTSYAFGSPPLALRSGMMSAAMYPFMFAMALKFNPISLLTGISHAHLQTFHQATCILALIFAIIHTAAFVNSPLREGGMNALKEVWSAHFTTYWSGTVAVFFMLWLCLSSFGVFRKMSYEFFVVQHITSAALFFGFSFVHFENLLNSHIWLWATLGIWLLSIVVRSLMVLFSSNFFCGPRAKVRVLTQVGKEESLDQERPAEFLRLSFETPLRWHAGQHVFVRFPGVYPWQAHPFTCLSIPSASPHLPNKLVLFARVQKGITRQLYDMTAGHGKEHTVKERQAPILEKTSDMSPESGSNSSMDGSVDNSPTKHIFQDKPLPFDQDTREITAYLDGPYSHNYSLGMYEHAVLVAGGSGITFCLPQVSELVRRSVQGDPIITKTVHLIWTIRSYDMIRWIKEELQQLDDLTHRSDVSVQMHVFASREMVAWNEEPMHDFLNVHHGLRADFVSELDQQVSQAMDAQSRTMCILACAPKDLVCTVGNKVSSLNARIAMGGLGTLRDVRFVPELFSF